MVTKINITNNRFSAPVGFSYPADANMDANVEANEFNCSKVGIEERSPEIQAPLPHERQSKLKVASDVATVIGSAVGSALGIKQIIE